MFSERGGTGKQLVEIEMLEKNVAWGFGFIPGHWGGGRPALICGSRRHRQCTWLCEPLGRNNAVWSGSQEGEGVRAGEYQIWGD